MAWFIGQSLVIISVAFLLGLLVGWLWWGRPWQRHADEAHPVEGAEPADVAEPAPGSGVALEATSTAPEPASEPEPARAVAEPEPELEPARAVAEPERAPAVAEPEPELEPAHAIAEPEPEPEPEPAPVVAEPEPEPELEPPHAIAEPEPEPVAVPAQAGPAAAESRSIDDLKRIEGIGPQMSGALQRAGIRTYAQLAEADDATLRAAIEAAGLRFAPSLVTWARQARLLADGDEEGFADLTRRLVAGRDEGRS